MAQYDKLIGDRLELKVVYATSAEDLHSAANLELLPLIGEKAITWSNLKWVSTRYCTYPQTLIFEITESSALIKELRLVSHEHMIGKRIELFVGIGKDFKTCDFRRIGHVYFSSNRQTGFTAREKKNIKMDATANFFKLSITECHQTVKNLYEQVSLVAVEAYGINNVPHVSNLNVAYESPIKSKINMPNDDPTSKFVLPKLGEWNALEAHSEISTEADVNEVDQVLLSLGLGFDLVAASRPAVTMDLATQRLLAVVESEKDRAVNREDFVKAQKIQEQINQLRDIGIQLIIEEENKHYAIACDDYKTASLAKKKITRMFTIREEIASENQFRRDALDNNIIKKKPKKKKPTLSPKRPAKIKKKSPMPKSQPSPKVKQLNLSGITGNQNADRAIKPASTTDGVMNETSSALLIQKMHRGKQQRQILGKKYKVVLHLQAAYRGNKVRLELTPEQKQTLQEAREKRQEVEDEKESAKKIQAVFRGRKVRENMSEEHKETIELAKTTRIAEERGKEIAAKKIQKTYKAKKENEENNAAAKIQASFRGKQARKEVDNKRKGRSRNERPVGAAFHNFDERDPFGQPVNQAEKKNDETKKNKRARANPNDPLQAQLEAWIESELPDKNIELPDLLEGFERTSASQIIEAFGETIAACTWSKNWKLRVAAAGTVANHCDKLQVNKPLIFRAHCMLGERLFNDKNPSVVFRMLILSKKILTLCKGNDGGMNVDLVAGGLDRMIPTLLQRTGDNNKNIREKVTEYIVGELCNTLTGPSHIFKKVEEYEKTVKSIKAICGVSILMKTLLEKYDIEKKSGISFNSVMKIVVTDLRHGNPDVRACAVDLCTIVHFKNNKVESHLVGVKLSTLKVLKDSIIKYYGNNSKDGKKFQKFTDKKLLQYIQKEEKKGNGRNNNNSNQKKKQFLMRKDNTNNGKNTEASAAISTKQATGNRNNEKKQKTSRKKKGK